MKNNQYGGDRVVPEISYEFEGLSVVENQPLSLGWQTGIQPVQA